VRSTFLPVHLYLPIDVCGVAAICSICCCDVVYRCCCCVAVNVAAAPPYVTADRSLQCCLPYIVLFLPRYLRCCHLVLLPLPRCLPLHLYRICSVPLLVIVSAMVRYVHDQSLRCLRCHVAVRAVLLEVRGTLLPAVRCSTDFIVTRYVGYLFYILTFDLPLFPLPRCRCRCWGIFVARLPLCLPSFVTPAAHLRYCDAVLPAFHHACRSIAIRVDAFALLQHRIYFTVACSTVVAVTAPLFTIDFSPACLVHALCTFYHTAPALPFTLFAILHAFCDVAIRYYIYHARSDRYVTRPFYAFCRSLPPTIT